MDMASLLEKGGWKVSREKKGKKPNGNKEDKNEIFFKTYLSGKNKYFLDDEKKQINSDFVDSYARELVAMFTLNRNKNKLTQLRGFYNAVCKIDSKLNGNNSSQIEFNDVKYKISMLKSYAENKENNGVVSQEFKKFIHQNVDAVKDKRDLKAFRIHFEAIMGYMPKDR